jgi:hydrogenase nickel incorporation protein HypA/HybF
MRGRFLMKHPWMEGVPSPMHELSVCQSLLREVARVAAAHDSTDVHKIVVAIGPLSGIEAPLLARAFEVARAGTIAAHAELDIELAPVVVWCRTCQSETPVAANTLLCGRCGAWQVQLKSGDELLLKRMELTDVVQSAAAE